MNHRLFVLAFCVGLALSCTYTIQSGDTLSAIAAAQKCSLDSILAANPGINASLIQVGQNISLPDLCLVCGAKLPTTPGCDKNILPLTLNQVAAILTDLKTTFTGQAAPYCDVHTPESMIAPLNDALAKFEITTPLRLAAFLGQVGHESADLRCWEENPAFTGKCANVNGNDYSGGCKYRGRGPIQLTNDFNYQAANSYLAANVAGYASNITTDPDLVRNNILVGFETTGWFWTQNALVNGVFTNLNIPAEAAASDCRAFANITIGIQGGCQVPSQTSRVERYCRARKFLGVDPEGTSCGYQNFPCPQDACVPLTVTQACTAVLNSGEGIFPSLFLAIGILISLFLL